MNIMNQLTLRSLKQNKRRTIVTMIGVIISVAMLMAVSTIAVSFMDLLKRQEISDNGNWHVLYGSVPKDKLQVIEDFPYTDKVILSKDLGYAPIIEPQNEYKPYVFVKAYNESGFDSFPITLIDGDFPKSENEIVLPQHFIENEEVGWKIGDKLSLPIGPRVFTDDDGSYEMDQSFGISPSTEDGVEELQTNETKEFIITGIIERPKWEPISAPGYTAITYFNTETADVFNVSTRLSKVSNKIIFDAEALGEVIGTNASLNYPLLRYEGFFADDLLSMKTALITLSAIIMTIIVVGSVSLIYNAFAISVSERSRYLGMLSSVGATKKQKRASVYFEGAIIGLISIPLGMISGIGAMAITFIFINDMLQKAFEEFTENLQVTVTPWSIIIAIFVSILTIFIATYIPARRASRITAIDAIRQAEDVKLTEKQVKTNRLTKKLFGTEADFALKNLKRNKRRYQVTVFSLVISIILFLSTAYFTMILQESVDVTIDSEAYDIAVFKGNQSDLMWERLISNIESLDEVTSTQITSVSYFETEIPIQSIPDKLVDIYDVADDQFVYHTVRIHTLDEASFRDYAIENGVSSDLEDGEAFFINHADFHWNGIHYDSEVILINPEDELSFYNEETDLEKQFTLRIANLTMTAPIGTYLPNGMDLALIVTEETFQQLVNSDLTEGETMIYLNSKDPMKTEENINEFREVAIHLKNTYKNKQQDEQFLLIFQVFIYGFIALITAISIANIFNTIATGMMLRRREFAMLKSVGMTPKSFRKMIIYESAFYGIKALAIGLPISGLIMYAMYYAMKDGFTLTFFLPWLHIGIAILGIFVIVGSAMIYAMGKIKHDNIIDALKQENT